MRGTADTGTNGLHSHPPGDQLNLNLRTPALLGATMLVAIFAALPALSTPPVRAAGDETVMPALTPPAPVVDRIAGSDRFATAVAASVSTFPATALGRRVGEWRLVPRRPRWRHPHGGARMRRCS